MAALSILYFLPFALWTTCEACAQAAPSL